MQKKAFFFKNIWSYQKKAVPLHPLLKNKHVFLAQLVEQLTLNQWVQGSSPWEDTKGYPKRYPFFVLLCGLEPSNNIGLRNARGVLGKAEASSALTTMRSSVNARDCRTRVPGRTQRTPYEVSFVLLINKFPFSILSVRCEYQRGFCRRNGV